MFRRQSVEKSDCSEDRVLTGQSVEKTECSEDRVLRSTQSQLLFGTQSSVELSQIRDTFAPDLQSTI